MFNDFTVYGWCFWLMDRLVLGSIPARKFSNSNNHQLKFSSRFYEILNHSTLFNMLNSTMVLDGKNTLLLALLKVKIKIRVALPVFTIKFKERRTTSKMRTLRYSLLTEIGQAPANLSDWKNFSSTQNVWMPIYLLRYKA